MFTEEYKKIKDMILAELKKIDVVTVSEVAGLSENNIEEMDRATTDMLNKQYLEIRGRSNMYRDQLINALRKLEVGSYGECEVCGDEIDIQRLFARPVAVACICCQEALERNGSSYL